MKIVIPGGSGQIGTLLARAFHRDGHEVVVLSRRPRPAAWRVAAWDVQGRGEAGRCCDTGVSGNRPDWWAEIDGADVVINLAGRSVNCRTTGQRREILTRA
jgi:NAD dependent epimerase/dehydratase family enzyme